MSWWRRHPIDPTALRWPSSDTGGVGPRPMQSSRSCLVTAMSAMLALPVLGGAITIVALFGIDQIVAVPDWLSVLAFLGGIGAGFGGGMWLVGRIWRPRLDPEERGADLVVRDDHTRSAVFAMASHLLALGIVLAVVAVYVHVGYGVVAAVCALGAIVIAPAARFGVRVTGSTLVVRGAVPWERRIDRAEIADMGVRQRFRGWAPAFYVVTCDERLTRIPFPHEVRRSRRWSDGIDAPWVGALHTWWVTGSVPPPPAGGAMPPGPSPPRVGG